MASAWFETVAVAQRRAEQRLPKSVYAALVAGSEKGLSSRDNLASFDELGFAPHVAGLANERSLATTVMGQAMSMPVLISPTGVQAVHPDGEVAVARAAANRGVAMGLSSFASRSLEDVCSVNDQVLFQLYWSGERETMLQRLERARDAGAKGIILTLDWSFANGRDWGSPWIPDRIDLQAMVKLAPEVLARPRWLWSFARSGHLPEPDDARTWPDPASAPPTFFGAYGEWMSEPVARMGRRRLAAPTVGGTLHG